METDLLMAWSDEFSVGIASIDVQHQKLIDLINQLHAAMKDGKGDEVMGNVLNELINYTVEHFSYEENLMEVNGYPTFSTHKAAHDSLKNQVTQVKADFDAGKGGMSIQVMNFLKDWLTNHILHTDKNYSVFLTEKGVV